MAEKPVTISMPSHKFDIPWLSPKAAAFGAAIAFGVTSIALTLFNKIVLSTYSFHGTHTLTFCQGVVAIICLLVMRHYRFTSFPLFDVDIMRKSAMLSMLYFGKILTSTISLGRVNVPMFTSLRQLSIVFVMVEEYVLLGVVPQSTVVNAVLVIAAGAGIAVSKDLSFDVTSYSFIFFANLFSSLYAVYITLTKKETQLDVFGMLYYNYLVLMPLVLVLGVITGDFASFLAFDKLWDVGFQISFQASVFLAFFLNVSAFYCTILNSARTKTVTTSLKNFFTMILGLVMFADYTYDHVNFLGLMVSFVGGVWYSYLTYSDKPTSSNRTSADPGGDRLAIKVHSHPPSSTDVAGLGSPEPFTPSSNGSGNSGRDSSSVMISDKMGGLGGGDAPNPNFEVRNRGLEYAGSVQMVPTTAKSISPRYT